MTEDFKVKLDAGVSRAELLIEAERRRVAARRSCDGSGDSADEKNGDILNKIEKTRRFSAPGSRGNLLDGKILGSLEDTSNNRSSERDSFLGNSSPRGSKKNSLKKTFSHEPDKWESSKRSKRSSKKGDVSIELSDMSKKKKKGNPSDGNISDCSE